MNDANPKQQIVDRIKNVTNILVTVSKNPSVDELSAAIGLTLMLNKLDKHATAVFSGQIPPAITFLEPDKTLENTVDSLRDFIIALDKEKADRLRYRVEDDVVRIFITPYRTKISESDLEFTHGDFNVELVLALGVENQDELDGAIAAHGKILHDATVATLSAQNKKSSLGSIDWQDTQASSLSEMLVAVSESLKGQEPLLDEQIATALLTGIVSATDRFSNNQTSPKAMTMAAQLMAAGANQQLIAARLEETHVISPETPQKADGELTEDTSEKLRGTQKPEEEQPVVDEQSQDLGEMTIEHQEEDSIGNDQTSSPEEEQVQVEIENQDDPKSAPPALDYVPSATIEEHDRRAKKQAGEEALDAALSKLNAVSPPSTLEQELQQAVTDESTISGDTEEKIVEPSMGGTFSATAEDAAEAKRREEESNRNKIIMSHGGQVQVPEDHEQARVSTKGPTLQPLSTDNSAPHQTLADIEAEVHNQPPSEQPALPQVDHADTARQEINSLFDNSTVADPSLPTVPSPSSVDQTAPALPPPPPLPDFSTLPPLPTAEVSDSSQQAAISSTPAESQTPPPPPAPDQFRIPGV